MSDIFISYARHDERLAEMLAEALRREGWTVWWDAFLRVAEVFSEGLKSALAETRCVVVLWSSASVKSEWVMTEALAGDERSVLVPAKIEDKVAIPERFAGLQAARLTGFDGRRRHPGFRRLVDAITRVAGPGNPLASEPLEFSKVLDIPGASSLTSAFGSLWVSAEEGPGLVRLDRAGKRIAEIPVGRAWAVIGSADYVWPVHGRGVTRVDPATNDITANLELGDYRGGVDKVLPAGRVLWVVAMPQWLVPEIYALPAAAETLVEFGSFIESNPSVGPYRLPNDRLLTATADRQGLQILSGPPLTVERTIRTGEITARFASEDSIWWDGSDARWRRLDLQTLEITIPQLPPDCLILAEDSGRAYVWFPGRQPGTARIAQLNISSGEFEVLHAVDHGIPDYGLVGGGFLWVESRFPDQVIQIELESRALVAEIPINERVIQWKFRSGALWMRQPGIGDQLTRIDPMTSRITATTTTYVSEDSRSQVLVEDDAVLGASERENGALALGTDNGGVERTSGGPRRQQQRAATTLPPIARDRPISTLRPAQMTAIDLPATRSHRGDRSA